MIYSKLPVVLLSTMTSEKEGSINNIIAEFILSNINSLGDISIKDLAKQCNVAVSSISRFCKEIGLRDYSELKEIISNADFKFERASEKNIMEERIKDYGEIVKASIEEVYKSLDSRKIKKLCNDIKKYKKVSIFGMLKAESAALSLVSDLLMLDKKAYSKVSFNEQMNYIENADEEDLIIIFSYTGIYFDYKYRNPHYKIKKPKIYLITGGENKYKSFINEVINFSSKQDMLSHPYQLEFIAGLIAQEYARCK